MCVVTMNDMNYEKLESISCPEDIQDSGNSFGYRLVMINQNDPGYAECEA